MNDTDKIPPALTPEEWAKVRDMGNMMLLRVCVGFPPDGAPWGDSEEPAAIAAAVLNYAGPDGGPMFTHADCTFLRTLADALLPFEGVSGNFRCERLKGLASSLESLLPPA